MSSGQTPFVPAQAGIQGDTLMHAILSPRFRGDERMMRIGQKILHP